MNFKTNINHSQSDFNLIEDIQKDNSNSFAISELIDRHSGIYVDMVNSYYSNPKGFRHKQELLQDKDYNIYMAALKYDPSRGTKFSTHLGNETKWICLNHYNKVKLKNHREMEFKEELNNTLVCEENSMEEDEILKRIKLLIRKYSDPRARQIFELRYFIGEGNKLMAWERVSQKVGISIQGCINIHDRALDQFKSQIEMSHAK